MVVIFGWGEGDAKDLGEVAPVTCPNCHNEVFLHDVRSEKRLSLYFVPLVPYGGNEYLACPICRNGMEIRPEHRAAIDEMRAATTVYRKGSVSEDYYRSRVEQFWARIGARPSGQPVAAPPERAVRDAAPIDRGTSERGGASPASLAEQLEGLAKLHADGVLTDAEFSAAKQRLLGY